MEEKVVVVRYFNSVNEAEIVCALLRDNGIDCEIINENIAGLFPGNPLMDLKIGVLARQEDAEKIESLLA